MSNTNRREQGQRQKKIVMDSHKHIWQEEAKGESPKYEV